jgi:hypothetical protein
MSLISFSEAHSRTQGIDVEGFVKSMEQGLEVQKNYLQVPRRVCNAKLISEDGKMIDVAFWGDDINKVRNNLKIRITDAKWDETKKVLYKTEFGEIIVYGFNPNSIYDDVLNLKKRNKIKSFRDYYSYIKNDFSSHYLGMDKKQYLKITEAFWTIEKLENKKRNKIESSAIRYLFDKINLSYEQIHEILSIFGILISCQRILSMINYKKQIKHSVVSDYSFTIIENSSDDEVIHLETFSSVLPSEISVDEQHDDSTSKITSNTNYLDYYRRYHGNFNYYGRK